MVVGEPSEVADCVVRRSSSARACQTRCVSGEESSRTLILHAPLQLHEDGLARQSLQEGLGVHQHLFGWCVAVPWVTGQGPTGVEVRPTNEHFGRALHGLRWD